MTRRILGGLLLALLCVPSVFAQRTSQSPARDIVTIEIPEIRSATESAWVDVSAYGHTTHTLTFTYVTKPDAVTVALQCSNDNGATATSTIDTSTSVDGATISGTAACNAIRVAVSDLMGSIRIRPVYQGSTPPVFAFEAEVEGADGAILDGTDPMIKATVLQLMNGNPVLVGIADTNGDPITSFGGDGTIIDGVDPMIKATVLELMNSNPIAATIVDGNGDPITSFGGGTQYTEGDTDSSITGTALLFEGAANALVAAPGTAANGLLVDVSRIQSIAAGNNNIGDVDVASIAAGNNNIGDVDVASIAAGNNNIGDVDVASIVPGTGATNLGKAVDTATGATDTGVLFLGTRDDSLSTLTPAEGDNVQARFTSTGALWTQSATVDAAEGAAVATSPVPVGCVYRTSFTTLDVGDVGYLLCDVNGRQIIVGQAADGAAVAGAPVRIGGKDGSGNAQDILTDSSGNLIVTGATAPAMTMNSATANTGVTAAMAIVFDDNSPTALTENNFGYVRGSQNHSLYTQIRDAAGNERGVNVTASNELSVNCGNCTGTTPAFADDSAFTVASDDVVAIGFQYDATPDSVDDGDIGIALMTADRRQIVTGAGGTFPVTAASSSFASGAFSSGAFASGSVASGAIASGAIASGAFAAGSLNAALPDPCLTGTKLFIPISQTSNTELFTGTASNRTYVCSMVITQPSDSTQTFALVSGTGSTCGTSTGAMIGGTSAANGVQLPFAVSSVSAIAKSDTDADNVCLLQSGSDRLAGVLSYVVAAN